jgi:tetratricopeptide (TPR) repeat protein
MKRRKKYKKSEKGDPFKKNPLEEPENYFVIKDEDDLLFDRISEYMKGRFDLEDVLNDPDLTSVQNTTNQWMQDYNKLNTGYASDRKFVKDALAIIYVEKQIENDISLIHSEIELNNLDELTEGWVKEWKEEKSKNSDSPEVKVDIKNFVAKSLEVEPAKTNHSTNIKETNKSGRSHFIRYSTITAAASISLFILIRILLPSSDPDKLFKSYYSPFEVKSDVTRNTDNGSNSRQVAILHYKSGDYKSALIGFTEILNNDSTSTDLRFYTGLTCLATGDYKQTVKLLESISNTPGEYQKEALWYLGLACLKTGEKEKSVKSLSLLVQSSDYYKDRAKIILRFLK